MKRRDTASVRSESIPIQPLKGASPVIERLILLDRTQRYAVLATTANDQPHASLVAFALAPGMEGIVFATPKETRKYRNILANGSVSVLIDSRTNTDKDYHLAESITANGTARPVRKGKRRDDLAGALKAKHPALSAFIDSDTTALVIVRPSDYIHVGAFQTVTHARPGEVPKIRRSRSR